MYSVELKIKRKNLADEARDIRKEERKAYAIHGGESSQFRSLHEHRTFKVRRAARHAHLAHAFLVGRPYRAVEKDCHTEPSLSEVTNLVRRFGGSGYENAERNEVAKAVVNWYYGKDEAAEKAA